MVNGFIPFGQRPQDLTGFQFGAQPIQQRDPFQPQAGFAISPVEQQLRQRQQNLAAAIGQQQQQAQAEQAQLQTAAEQQTVAPVDGATTESGGGFGSGFADALAAVGAGVKPTSGRGFEDLATGFLSAFSAARGAKAEAERAKAEAPRKEKRAALEDRKFEAEVKKLEKELEGGKLLDPIEIAKLESGVRKEFTNLSKDFFTQRDAFGRIQGIVGNDPSKMTPADDIALIFNFMKVNDPGSTVREGEFATAENAASIPTRIRVQYNKALKGDKLLPKQRMEFVNTSRKLFNAADRQHNRRIDSFTGISERQGLDTRNVVLDLGLAELAAQDEQGLDVQGSLSSLSNEELDAMIAQQQGQ